MADSSVTVKKVKAEQIIYSASFENLTPEALRYGPHSYYPANTPYPPFTS